MRILILNWRDCKNPKSGGAEFVTHEHAKGWIKAGHNVTWFTSAFSGSEAREIIDEIRIVRKGNELTVHFYAILFYLSSKNQYDLVIDEIHGLPFFTPLFVKKPKIAFIHEVAGIIWDAMYPFPINKLGKLIEKVSLLLYKNELFWTDSPSTVDDLVAYGIPRKNCNAIFCPIGNKPLYALPRKEKVPTFIFVSRIVKMKGIETVIASFAHIQKALPDAQLWIVGGGEKEYVRGLKDSIVSLGLQKKVIFFDFVATKTKLDLLRKSWLLLHASVKEGWGLVVIEAASQATPAVVYNVGGLRDSVKNGKTGIVLNENNSKTMAQEALALIQNKDKYLSFQKNGLRWVENITWEKALQQSSALLKQATSI